MACATRGVSVNGAEATIPPTARVLWRGAAGQEVLAVDDHHAVIRSSDRKTLSGR
jgi:hypothetical protein